MSLLGDEEIELELVGRGSRVVKVLSLFDFPFLGLPAGGSIWFLCLLL